MKGQPDVIERLDEAPFLEPGAINRYRLQYRLLEDRGYARLARKARATGEVSRSPAWANHMQRLA